MSKSSGFAVAVAAVLCMAGSWTGARTAAAGTTPSNEELYRMILELQAGQQRLIDDANRARAEAAKAREELEATKQELEAAHEQLEARTPAAETPAVSTAPAAEAKGFVREADLPRGIAPWGEVHVLRTTDDAVDFAILSTDEDPILGVGSNKIIQSKSQVSGKVGVNYSPGGAQDFAVGFQWFDNTDSAKLIPPFEHPDGNNFVTLIATLNPPGTGVVADHATAHEDFRLKALDTEAGENLAVGENLLLRLFGGVRYTNMNEHFQAMYFGGDFDPTAGARSNSDWGFWGVGPRVGASGRYPLPWGFHLFGQAGVSVLVGEQEAEIGFQEPAETTELAFVHRDNGVRVIPSIDMRAGLGWEHGVADWGSVFVDGGYEFQDYFNVVERMTWGPAGATGAINTATGDFGIDGFFFRGGFRFNGP